MGPYKTSDQATSHLELITNIRAATEWLQSNNEEWSPSLTGRKELLISARELDCLKWTAAGKTALEASIILGISERTVRFHLNAAREKLDCVTTTQAVAKAIANQLIEI